VNNKFAIAGVTILVAGGAAVVGAGALADIGPSSGRIRPTKESFCSVAIQTNGSRLLELVRTGTLGGSGSRDWVVDGITNMAPREIRPDMVILSDGIKMQPANPSPETIAAAGRVDAYVLKTCTGVAAH
jgi:hypothetical protein